MFLALVDFEVLPQDLPAALAALAEESGAIRTMPGNLAFRVFTAADRPGAVSIRHEWTDAGAFSGYLASPAFAASGKVLRPLMTATPRSRRFEANLLETV